jgi:hypothetical protein
MRCPYCNSEVESGASHCTMCGHRLSARRGLARGTSRWQILAVLAIVALVCIGGGILLSWRARSGQPASTGLSPTPRWISTPSVTSTPPHRATAPPPTPTPASVLSSGPDPYEPDDSIDDAAAIGTDGLPQKHNLHYEGDHDYVSFQATVGKAYTIETQNLGADIDPIIYLYDSQGQELAHNDDGADEPLASRIVWVAPSSGLYYVMVRDLGEDSAGFEARYSLTVLESAFAEGVDPYEPDDTPGEATRITSDGTRQTHTFNITSDGTRQTHTFNTTTDVDFVSFVAQEGQRYTIQTGDLSSGCDTTIYLYDEAGFELEYDDDAAEDSVASQIVWTAPSTGVYYVKIMDFAGRAGPDVSYQVWVSVQ